MHCRLLAGQLHQCENDVTPINNRHCSTMSGLKVGIVLWKYLVNKDTEMFNDTITHMEQQVSSLKQHKRITSATIIANSVNPGGELVEDSDNELCDSLVEYHSSIRAQRDYETEEEDVTAAVPVQPKEASKLLPRLRSYEE